MAGGFRRPRHARVAQEWRAREAPGPPGLLATACGPRRNARVLLKGIGRGEAFPWCAAGDEQAGSPPGSGPGQGVQPRAVGMGLGTWRPGVVAVGHGLPSDAEWGAQGWPQADMGGGDTVIGRECPGPRERLAAGGDAVPRAHGVDPAAPVQGGAAWRVAQRRRLAQTSAVSWLGQPVQARWNVVVEGTGTVVRTTACGTGQAPAGCDEWSEGTPGGALRRHGRKRVTVCEEACALECRSGGVVFGAARDRATVSGWTGQRTRTSSGRHADTRGPVLRARHTADRVSVDAWAPRLAPRVDGCGAVGTTQALTPRSARGLEAASVWGIRPIEPANGGTVFWRRMGHGCPPTVGESCPKGQAGGRSAHACSRAGDAADAA